MLEIFKGSDLIVTFLLKQTQTSLVDGGGRVAAELVGGATRTCRCTSFTRERLGDEEAPLDGGGQGGA